MSGNPRGPNPQQPPQFNRPSGISNQKVKVSQAVTFYRFILGGLGYGSIDFISKSIFGEGNHTQALKAYQAETSEKIREIEFSKEKMLQKLSEHANLVELQQQLNQSSQSDSSIKCFIYGFLATNLGGVFHAKVNQIFSKKGYSANKKIIFSPFAFIPFYLFCGIYDKLPFGEIASRMAYDFVPLLGIRLVGDIIRHKQFSSAEHAAIQAGNQFMSSPKQLIVLHTALRGIYIFAMDTLYHKRVTLF